MRALGRLDLDQLVVEGLQLVLDTLGADDARLVEPSSSGGIMIASLDNPRRTDGGHDGERFADLAAALVRSDLVADVLAADEPTPVGDFHGAGVLLVPMRTREHGSCVLSVLTAAPRAFRDAEIGFVRELAAVLVGAINVRWTEHALRWRSQLDQLLTEVSTGFIDLSPDDIGTAAHDALALVGEFVGAGRGEVFVLDDHDRPVSLARWSRPGAQPGPDVVELRMHAHGRSIGHVEFATGGRAVPWHGDIAASLHPLADIFAQAVAYERYAVALAASESRYRSLVEEVRDVIVRVDATGRISFVNQAWTELTGLTPEDTLGRGCFDSIHPDDHRIAAEHIASVTRGEDNAARSVRFIAKDGTSRWMEVKGRALFDADGNLAGLSGVLHDVTENKIAEAKIHAALEEAVRAREEAERSSRAKSTFLSRMSHELRTPLNAILGFAQLLEYAGLGEDDLDSLRLIRQAGQHLLSLVDDTMDIARTDTGDLGLALEPVVVGDAWQECLALVGCAAAARRLTITEVAPADRRIRVVADRRRLTQAMVNLMSNAVKYNREGGTVTMACRPLEPGEAGRPPGRTWARISLTDTGHGVPADRYDEMFVPFNRLGAELTDVEGTGIGLALTKSLVEAMGGHIGLTSTEGAGSTFFVDLPVAPDPAS